MVEQWTPITDKKKLKKAISKWRADAGWHSTYTKSPGWFNHLYSEKPMRRQTRDLLIGTKKLQDYEETMEFPLHKKPHIYYW